MTIAISSSIAPKPFRWIKYRCNCAASTDGATRDHPNALATSSTTPLYCLVKVVFVKFMQMSPSLISRACLPCASKFSLQKFAFSACQLCTISSVCSRLSSPASGSRDRVDTLPVRDWTGANACLATRGQCVSPRHRSATATGSVLACACVRARAVWWACLVFTYFYVFERQ